MPVPAVRVPSPTVSEASPPGAKAAAPPPSTWGEANFGKVTAAATVSMAAAVPTAPGTGNRARLDVLDQWMKLRPGKPHPFSRDEKLVLLDGLKAYLAVPNISGSVASRDGMCPRSVNWYAGFVDHITEAGGLDKFFIAPNTKGMTLLDDSQVSSGQRGDSTLICAVRASAGLGVKAAGKQATALRHLARYRRLLKGHRAATVAAAEDILSSKDGCPPTTSRTRGLGCYPQMLDM